MKSRLPSNLGNEEMEQLPEEERQESLFEVLLDEMEENDDR